MRRQYYTLSIAWVDNKGVLFSQNVGSLNKALLNRKLNKCLESFKNSKELKIISAGITTGITSGYKAS